MIANLQKKMRFQLEMGIDGCQKILLNEGYFGLLVSVSSFVFRVPML
jgi:hypothetical protein